MQEINPIEVLQEMQNTFPKETQICIQAVQIRHLQAQVGPEEEEEEDS